MSLLLVYGKVILDSLRLANGERVTDLLGGGGPQGVMGARLFWEEVGFLTRTGTDLGDRHIQQLRDLKADLQGWKRYAHLRTPRLGMSYDHEQNMLNEQGEPIEIVRWEGNWAELLAQNIPWPDAYRSARCVHLITELPDEQMVRKALRLREETGAWVSLEPLIDTNHWSNLDAMLKLVPEMDVVCPDQDSACTAAGVDDPAVAAQRWHEMGAAHVAVRAGSLGSFVAGRGLAGPVHVPPIQVQIQDPTGAGNAYAGGFVASLLAGMDPPLAGCQATAAAAMMLEVIGMPAYSPAASVRAQALARRHFDTHIAV